MAEAASPDPRSSHESALIGEELHLFGGKTKKEKNEKEEREKNDDFYLPRSEIWTCTVRGEKKWICRVAEEENIPPPCEGAQCVVINGIIYSYGGQKEDGGLLGEVFGLDPKKMIWIQVATHGKKPCPRCYCCLWAIGGRMIMFGGESDDISKYRLQSGAQFERRVNNEIYEFVFEEGREKGYWLDVELSGKRPQPRQSAAMETIDQDRGLLHGGYGDGKHLDDAFELDLKNKIWICIDFFPNPKPSARWDHRICRLSITGLKERNCFLLVGGYNRSESPDHVYILDLDKENSYIKSYKFCSNLDIAPVYFHTLHCVDNQDGPAQIIVTGGEDWKNGKLKEITISLSLGQSNEAYMRIESIILSSAQIKPATSQKDVRELERQLETLREELETRYSREIALLQSDHEAQRTELEARCRDLKNEVSDLSQELQTKNIQLKTLRDSFTQHSRTKFDKERQTDGSVASSETEVDREVTDEELQLLASKLIGEWKEVRRRLPGDKESEAALEIKHRFDPKELVYSMLSSWHKCNGSSATVRCICVALVKRPVINRQAAEDVFGCGIVTQVLHDLHH